MLFAIPSASFGCINAMLHQTFLFLGQIWQLFEVSQTLEFFTVIESEYLDYLVNFFSHYQPVIPVLYILYITFQFSRTISQR